MEGVQACISSYQHLVVRWNRLKGRLSNRLDVHQTGVGDTDSEVMAGRRCQEEEISPLSGGLATPQFIREVLTVQRGNERKLNQGFGKVMVLTWNGFQNPVGGS